MTDEPDCGTCPHGNDDHYEDDIGQSFCNGDNLECDCDDWLPPSMLKYSGMGNVSDD